MKQTFIIFLLFSFVSVFSQSRKELESKKLQNEKDIHFTNELISKTEKNKNESYNKLILISSKIESRNKIINDIKTEIKNIDKNISDHHELLLNLNDDYEKLINEYSNIVYYYYKNRNKYNFIMFVLSSDNFNLALNRIKRFQQYSKYRTYQVNEILSTKQKIEKELFLLDSLKNEKKYYLDVLDEEGKELLSEKNARKKEIEILDKQKEDLKKKLHQQVALAKELQLKIEKIISEEVIKSSNSDKKLDVFVLTPEEKELADSFFKNKNKLPWPTERGIITGTFGESAHPILKGVVVRNDGIDISTTEGSYIRSIFNGKVSRVFVIPGAHATVIIRHGNFLSVYSNLSDVFVKQGESVSTKQTIGKIYTEEGQSVLQFQIWQENKKLDPQEWLTSTKYAK